MARERYLVGVSEEELTYQPSPLPPMTPKGKLQNLWYHYKWGIIGGIFAVIVLTVFIVQTVTREEADHYICMATMSYIPDGIIAEMEQTLETYATDLNGDGEVRVSIQNLNISLEQGNTVGMTNRQNVLAHIAARDMTVYMFAPDYYATLEDAMAAGTTFFAPLAQEHDAVGQDGTWFTWDVYAFAKDSFPDTDLTPWEESLPTNLIVGVRALRKNPSDEEKAVTEAALAMLREYLKTHTAY